MTSPRVGSLVYCLLCAVQLASVADLCTASSAAGRSSALRASINDTTLQAELREAMGEALGCGGQVDDAHLEGIERSLAPTWRALPKTSEGRIDRRLLRYLVHRHFNRRSALHVRGFEPSAASGGQDILSQRVPAYVESVLASQHRARQGFDLRDAAHVVATLEQLIFDAESGLLERIYKDQGRATSASLSRETLGRVLQDYMVHWMMAGDEVGINILLNNRTYLEQVFPHWKELVFFTQGELKALDYKRQLQPHSALAEGSSRTGHNAMIPQYSFEDAHSVVGEITRSFSSYWEAECASLKQQLIAMDAHNTGRVPLSKFYGTGLEAEWRFGESEAYLRELGALDETGWKGKQVIIPNYLQGASNCIVTTPHYLVCCANDCEHLLGDIEAAIGASTAEPAALLALVSGLTAQTTLDDDIAPELGAALVEQLDQISRIHGGHVPLHGRLFQQWLHYVFPRDCPFPHKAGEIKATAPMEYGTAFVATLEQMQQHAAEANASATANATAAGGPLGRREDQWMTQWSSEEELITDFDNRFRAPWQRTSFTSVCMVVLFVFLMGFFKASKTGRLPEASLLPTHRSHFV